MALHDMFADAVPEALEVFGLESLDQYAQWKNILASGYEDADGEVYFIQCDDFVKIGYSKDVVQRFSDMQIGNPIELRLLARFPGSRETERELHGAFDGFRVRGEWFSLGSEVFDFIKQERLRIVTKG